MYCVNNCQLSVYYVAWAESSPALGRCIKLLFCHDGVYPFDNERSQLIPAEFINLSLPPQFRYKAENILLYLLMSENLKAANQRKYFKYVIDNELGSLHLRGIAGVPSVRILGISMDLKGREKFFQQVACNGYHSCSVCTTPYLQGLRTKPIFTGARMWLPDTSPLRNCFHDGFDFISEERRGAPSLRTTASVFEASAIAEEEGFRDFLGKSHLPQCITCS